MSAVSSTIEVTESITEDYELDEDDELDELV